MFLFEVRWVKIEVSKLDRESIKDGNTVKKTEYKNYSSSIQLHNLNRID